MTHKHVKTVNEFLRHTEDKIAYFHVKRFFSKLSMKYLNIFITNVSIQVWNLILNISKCSIYIKQYVILFRKQD